MVCKVAPKNSPSHRESNDSMETQNQESTNFEKALDAVGYGRFSRSALGASVFTFLTTGVENCAMSYALPAARCDLSLSTYQIGLLNMAFMCGGVASAFFWGIVGDVFGRRKTLSITLLMNAFLTLAQSTVTDYRMLLAARVVNGFLIGGPSTLVFSYLSDLVGSKRRQFYLNITGMSFVAAWLILPAVAWLLLPIKTSHPTILPIYSWRLYLAVGSIPGFVAGVWILLLPESPRFLVDTNRSNRAIEVMMYIHKVNSGGNEDPKVKKLLLETIETPKETNGDLERTKSLFVGVLKDLKLFVSKNYAFKSSLIMLAFFANMASGFGLNLWIPEILLRMQNHDVKTPITVPEKMFIPNNTSWEMLVYETRHRVNTSEVDSWKEECHEDINDEIFTSGLIVGACCLLVNVICCYVCRASGAGVRRGAALCAAGTAIACGAAAFAVSRGNSTITVAAASVINAASLNGNVLLIRLLLHALPARLSALGVCWGAWWGRGGGVVAHAILGAALDLSIAAPFIAGAIPLAVSIGAILLIKLEEETEQTTTKPASDNDNIEKVSGLDRYISTHI